MAWYWWILAGILGLNALVVCLIAFFLVADAVRGRRDGSGEAPGAGKGGTSGGKR